MGTQMYLCVLMCNFVGVKEFSPLRFYPKFDLTWDVCIDAMHTLPRQWKGHIFPLFHGQRNPSKPKPRKSWTSAENAKLLKDWEKAKAQCADWELDKVPYINCYLTLAAIQMYTLIPMGTL